MDDLLSVRSIYTKAPRHFQKYLTFFVCSLKERAFFILDGRIYQLCQ